jgi:uncharacterized protein (DUF305 family)
MNTRCIATRIALFLAAAVAASVTLAGCGGNTALASSAPSTTAAMVPTSAEPSRAHNQADVSFVRDMIPHHHQAIAMAELADNHAASPQVAGLASRIEAAQQPEIDQMNGFLRAWNASTASGAGSAMSSMPHMPGMSGMNHDQNDQSGMGSMPGMSMPGMMSEAQMRQLDQTSGPAFDKMFLRMMIGHHQSAVTMSQTELVNGQNPDAKALAQRIIDAQQREIAEMHSMLGG